MSAPPTVTNAPTPPTVPDDGDLWFNVLTGRTYVWYIGPSGVGTWVETQPTGGALVTARSVPGIVPQPPTTTPRDVMRVPEITVSPVPPANPLVGDLWWSPITGMECIWYDDGNSIQWVQTQPVKYINLATLAGPAGGDLTGMYPNPQIIPGVVLEQPQLKDPPDPALDDQHLVSAAWVNDRIATGISGPAGGDLAGTYPNPTIKAGVALTGVPTAPTAVQNIDTDQIATCKFVNLEIGGQLQFFAPLASPVFTGDPRAPTPPPTDNDTSIPTTAWVKTAIAAIPPPPTTLPPSGPAGGALSGTYPNPGLAVPYPTTLPPNGPAGGDLSGTYPNPTIKPSVINGQVLTTVAGVAAWAAASGGASISVGDTPPGSPTAGALWWNSVLGSLFIYYNDGNTTQWVPAAPSPSSAQIPSGAIMDFAGATAPAGWLICNGALVSRTVFPGLFAAIGTLYGAGDGSTTFGVPDLGGRVTAGKETTATRLTVAISGINGGTLGAVGGNENVQSHGHTTPDHFHQAAGNLANGVAVINGGTNWGFTTSSGNYVGFSNVTGSADRVLTTTTFGAGASANVPPTMIMNKIIKV